VPSGSGHGALDEDDGVHVACALPGELCTHDRIGQQRAHPAGLVVKQRNLRRVVAVVLPLVEEEQQTVLVSRRAPISARGRLGRYGECLEADESCADHARVWP
jgi:hypothetical protein